MFINITEYLANSLLTIFSMDLTYFENTVPVTKDIVNIMICTGWALLLGNMVFQATKSMATGLGFEGEDPRELFSRTFVMGFLLVASRQVCNIGLSITKKVIEMVQVPSVVQVPQLTEDAFSVPGDASWLLVIIIGVILIIQLIKLFFEIGERYVIVSILTILSPLAFAMGGSKNTSDIFKGWVRMFGSMCLMMVLSVVFLKFVLSAMSVVPSGAAVLPWTVFVVALAKAGRKIDGLIARIGLSPAITGDPLGSRLPGMLTFMVMRNMTGSMSRATAASSVGVSRGEASRPSPSSGGSGRSASPVRPPIGSSAPKDGVSSPAPAVSGGLSASGTKSTKTSTYKDASHTPASPSAKEASGSIGAEPKGRHEAKTSSKTATRPPISSSSTAKDFSLSGGRKPTSEKAAHTSSDLKKSDSGVAAKASMPITAKPTADIKPVDAEKGSAKSSVTSASTAKADIPLADKIRPPMSKDVQSAKTAKEGLNESGKASRPAATAFAAHKTGAEKSKMATGTRPSDASVVNKAGVINPKGGNVAQSHSNSTNVTVQQKGGTAAPSRPDVSTVRGEQGKQPVGRLPAVSAASGAAITKPPLSTSNDAQKTGSHTNIDTPQSVHGKGISESPLGAGTKGSYKNVSSRPEHSAPRNIETSKRNVTTGNSSKNTVSSAPSMPSVRSAASTSANTGVTSTATHSNASSTPNNANKTRRTTGTATNQGYNTKSPQTQKTISKPAYVSHETQGKPTSDKQEVSAPREKPVHIKQKQTSKEFDDKNKERLKHRPHYKPKSGDPKGGRDKN